jgi:inverted formin-2
VQITLLDGKRSLNVNIFLKQFRSTDREIIRMIINGDCKGFGLEKLRALMKLEPEFDECEMLKAFDGDVEKLGSAEKFLFQLILVPK